MRRRKHVIGVAGLGIGLALFGAVFTPQDRLIWNRTGSAPQGLPGDEICRWDTQLLINGKVGGEARLRDSSGRDLPSWEGCMVLGQDQLFLMNAHPDSLDGRYFGPVEIHDLVGVARLILAWR